MSLNFELGGIENWKSLHDEKNQPLPKTRDIIFSTISAGIGVITEKNYVEFYLRVAAADAMSQWPKGEPITLDDVKRHIGLRTNVTFEPAGKWFKRILDADISEIQYRIRRDAEAASKKETADAV
jgi:hypothetical protein